MLSFLVSVMKCELPIVSIENVIWNQIVGLRVFKVERLCQTIFVLEAVRE